MRGYDTSPEMQDSLVDGVLEGDQMANCPTKPELAG